MTLIAQFDLTEDPPAVVTLYDYGDDDVPKHYQSPEYVDVTDEEPRPQPGSTYDKPSDAWVHPPPPEDLVATATVYVDTNTKFLAVAVPSQAVQLAQLRQISTQVNKLLAERFGV